MNKGCKVHIWRVRYIFIDPFHRMNTHDEEEFVFTNKDSIQDACTIFYSMHPDRESHQVYEVALYSVKTFDL